MKPWQWNPWKQKSLLLTGLIRSWRGSKKVNRIIKKEVYLQILQEILNSSVRRLALGWSGVIQTRIRSGKGTDTVSQGPDMNPNENTWTVLRRKVCARKPTHLLEHHWFCQEEWFNFSQRIYIILELLYVYIYILTICVGLLWLYWQYSWRGWLLSE